MSSGVPSGDDVKAWLQRLVVGEVDISEIAADIDTHDVASEIDLCDLAEYIDDESVASHIELDIDSMDTAVKVWLGDNQRTLLNDLLDDAASHFECMVKAEVEKRLLLPRLRRLLARAKGFRLRRRKKSI